MFRESSGSKQAAGDDYEKFMSKVFGDDPGVGDLFDNSKADNGDGTADVPQWVELEHQVSWEPTASDATTHQQQATGSGYATLTAPLLTIRHGCRRATCKLELPAVRIQYLAGPEEALNRLELLVASCEAGNTSHALANEARAICGRLLEDGVSDNMLYHEYPALFE